MDGRVDAQAQVRVQDRKPRQTVEFVRRFVGSHSVETVFRFESGKELFVSIPISEYLGESSMERLNEEWLREALEKAYRAGANRD
jgi:hypothetical protein